MHSTSSLTGSHASLSSSGSKTPRRYLPFYHQLIWQSPPTPPLFYPFFSPSHSAYISAIAPQMALCVYVSVSNMFQLSRMCFKCRLKLVKNYLYCHAYLSVQLSVVCLCHLCNVFCSEDHLCYMFCSEGQLGIWCMWASWKLDLWQVELGSST